MHNRVVNSNSVEAAAAVAAARRRSHRFTSLPATHAHPCTREIYELRWSYPSKMDGKGLVTSIALVKKREPSIAQLCER